MYNFVHFMSTGNFPFSFGVTKMVRESRFAFDDRNSPLEPDQYDPLFDEDDPFFDPYPHDMSPNRQLPRPEERPATDQKPTPRQLADADWLNPKKSAKTQRKPRRKSQ